MQPRPASMQQPTPLAPFEAGRVRLTDVSPRDGLQNEAEQVATEAKIRLIASLVEARVDEVEITSFVSRKWIPQLGDAVEVCQGLDAWLTRHDWTLAGHAAAGARSAPLFSALVPNAKGMETLLEVNSRAGRRLIGKASVFTAASESFCRKNINATIAESIERFAPVISANHQQECIL